MEDSEITKILFWRPKRPDQCQTIKELDDYRYNEDPPANAKELAVGEEIRWSDIPKFSHARIYLKNGIYFNVWGDVLRVIGWEIQDIEKKYYEDHVWMGDYESMDKADLWEYISEIEDTPTELAKPKGIEYPNMVRWKIPSLGSTYPYRDRVKAKKFEKAFKDMSKWSK